MNIPNLLKNKYGKIAFLLSSIILIILLSIFIPKFLKQKSTEINLGSQQTLTSTSTEFSHPDSRPDEIKGKIITLKRLKPEYFQDLHKILSLPLMRKILYPQDAVEASFEFTKNLLNHKLKNEAEGKVLVYVIFDNKDKKLIGEVEIRDKNPTDPGQMTCWLNPTYWGKGRTQEVLALISKEYFKLKNVDSYTAHVKIWNLRGYYAFKKFGFKLIDFYYENGKATRYILEYQNPEKSQ